MRIAGVRVSPEYVRVLAQILSDAGYDHTAKTLTDALGLQVAQAPLTLDDHEAILSALGTHCPTGLTKLRRELLEDHTRRRRIQGL